jgi:hypothetical protein
LVGSLLGDGTLRRQNSTRRINALFEVNHSLEFRDYVDWKWRHFQSFVLTQPKSRKGNGKRVAYRFTTRSLPVFTRYYEWFYPGSRKVIPHDLTIDALALAVWFMDDGCRSRSSWYLNTQQFSKDEQEFLIDLLKTSFSIQATLNRDKEYFRIRISSSSGDQLRAAIDTHIRPCFRYKLTDDPVTTEPKGESIRQ